MIRYVSYSAKLIALLALVVAGGLFLNQDTSAQTTHFNPCANTALANSAAGAPSDITLSFGIGLDAACEPFSNPDIHPLQYNSGGLIYFTPANWGVTNQVPVGAKIGTFSSKAVLGLLNNPCTNVLNVPFDLYNATIDRNGPTVAEKAVGQPDRLSTMKPPAAGGVPAAASAWPTYLNDVATKEGMHLDQMIARYVGVNTRDVQGTTVVLNFLIFSPGATVSKKIQLDPALGFPSVTVLQDTSSVASDVDPVNDFCAPLWTQSTISGSVNGVTFRTNPTDGVYDFVTYVVPAPDADGDGIENSLDPCPYTDSSAWNPHGLKTQPGADSDGDGIPDDCDPHPNDPSVGQAGTGLSNTDEDNDGWQNQGDNCPLVSNPDQTDTDGDGIGDACDHNPTTVDGQGAPVCLVSAVTVGSGGTAPDANAVKALAPCDPNAVVGQPAAATNTPGPTPTLIPGTTTRPTVTPAPAGVTGGVGSGPAGGIGTLAPAGTSIPAWAAMLAVLGALGLCFGLALMGTRIWRRR